MNARFAALAGLLAAGCAVRAPAPNPLVQTEIERRTGRAVRPPDDRVDGALPPGVDLSDGVTEDEAVAIALWNNAALSADLASLGLARADLIQAGLLRNPQLQILLPTATKPFELWGQFAAEPLWQRPRRVAAAKLQWDQIAHSLVQNGLDRARDARAAHAALLQAESRARVAAEAAELRQQIASITQARLRAGDVSALEARTSETEAANTIEQLHRFRHDVEIARERLRLVLGLPPAAALRPMPGALSPTEPPPADALRELAWSGRPDLRALEVAIEAAAATGKWERSRLFALGALLSSKEFINNGFKTGPGVSFDIPIFRTNAGGVARADAQVEQAARAYLAQRQRVDLEVSESRAALAQALESLRDQREVVLPPARAALEEARRALEAGDASRLFVLETTRQLLDAQMREVDQEAAVRRFRAELDRSVGTKVDGDPRP